jgi:hypothetical protein
MQRLAFWPLFINRISQALRIGETPAIHAIGTHKIGVTELANRAQSVFFTPTPQIATGEAAKHSWAASLRALALQGVENFFDAIAHGRADVMFEE